MLPLLGPPVTLLCGLAKQCPVSVCPSPARIRLAHPDPCWGRFGFVAGFKKLAGALKMAMFSGLIPILHTTIENTTDYNGRNMWFGFVGVRLVTLYIAVLPWSKVDTDFQCDDNASAYCRKACFNIHFNSSVVPLWNFIFALFVISVLLMEYFASQFRYNFIKAKMERGDSVQNSDKFGLSDVKEKDLMHKAIMIDFHKQRVMLALYLACILLRLAIEVGFVYILLRWHMPKLARTPIYCHTWLCPGPYHCVVQAAAEKRMSVFILCTISICIIISCIVFFLYAIMLYLVLGYKHQGPPGGQAAQVHGKS